MLSNLEEKISQMPGELRASLLNSSIKFKKQDYDKLKARCKEEKQLFVDNLFLPNDSSLFKTRKIDGILWKRPHVRLASLYSLIIRARRP
jgi:hypothetical protein